MIEGFQSNLIIGAALFLIGIFNFIIYAVRVRKWNTTTGVVTGHTRKDEDNNYLMYIEFTDHKNIPRRIKGNYGGMFGSPIGRSLEVCYNPENPQKAFVCNATSRFIIPAVLIFIGMTLLLKDFSA